MTLRAAVRLLREKQASETAIDTAAQRADEVVTEGYAWLMVRRELWDDAMEWVTGYRDNCPLPLWAVDSPPLIH